MLTLITRQVGVVGRLGVFPMVRLTLPARRILAYMALQEQPVSRATASAQLWLDQAEAQGRANLRRALGQLPRGWIRSSGDELVLMAESDLVAARRIASRALDGGSLSLAEITQLSSDILPRWHDDWVLLAQDAFRLLRVQALEAACRTMAA